MSDACDKFGWLDRAVCADPGIDPDVFFDALRRPLAIALCNQCPVAAQCSDRAQEHNAYRGVWAGKSKMPKNPGRSPTVEYLAPHEQHRHSRDKKARSEIRPHLNRAS